MQKQYLEEHLESINTLFMGDSHMANGVDVKCFAKDSAFILAQSSRPSYFDGQLAKRYVPQMKNLKTVFMSLCCNYEYLPLKYTSSAENLRGFKSYCTMYYKYMGIEYKDQGSLLAYSEILNSIMSYAEPFLGKDKDSYDVYYKGFGFTCRAGRESNWENKGLPFPVDYSRSECAQVRQEVMDTYSLIAQTCRDNRVRLVLVATPYWHTANAAFTERNISDFKKFVDELTSKYPEVDFLDLSHDPQFGYDDFNDSNHLSPSGTKKLATILRDYIDGE